MRKQGLTELEPSQSKRRGESVWELENPFSDETADLFAVFLPHLGG
jgi:hypothetical protein